MSVLDPTIRVANQRLVTTNDLHAYITVCLLTHARAKPDDVVPDPSDLRGWWGDSYPDVEGDSIGSRLWTLQGRPMSEALRLAPEIVGEALQCAIDDGLLTGFETRIEAVAPDRLGIWVLPSRTDQIVVAELGPWQIAIG